MKKTLSCLVLLTWGLVWASAQDATTLQVTPSDQVVYPDASQVLNKTEPQPKTSTVPPASLLPSSRPLAVSAPVPARTAAKPATGDHGWFLQWTLKGDEAAVQAWAASLGRPVRIEAAGDGLWSVLEGPLEAAGLQASVAGQEGRAVLIRR